MKNTLIIPYISRDELVNRLLKLHDSTKIVGYSITYEDYCSCNNTKFGSTKMLPNDLDKYRLVEPDKIPQDKKLKAQARLYSEIVEGVTYNYKEV